MRVDDVLTTSFDQLAQPRRPLMVLALHGWFDVADVATTAVEQLFNNRIAITIAEIDPDPFYDFTQQRPSISFLQDPVAISWPRNDFRFMRLRHAEHDLVVLTGVEPHLRMATFAQAIVTVARALRCEAVITVGAGADAVPHTRLARVVSSTTDARLAGALGLAPPRYEGITGLIGVLQEALAAHDIPGVSLRVGVPHYLTTMSHPYASFALAQHLSHVLGITIDTTSLIDKLGYWRKQYTEVLEQDERLSAYVEALEQRYDSQTAREVSTGGDIAAQFEQFLRERDDPEP